MPGILFSQGLESNAPADPASGFTARNGQEQSNPQYPEKAYLHFDKPYYAIGDTIYFKAYVTLGAEHKLSALSGILYAELITPENKIARTLKLQITVGTAAGDFTLTDTLKSGNYRVRAYTNWMRNEGEDAFFEKVIPVGGTEVKRIPESGEPATAKKTAANKITNTTDIQFLPEGGCFIAGNYSKMAFKATGPDGLGKDVKGIVTNENGEEVCRFESGHAGMGSFTLVPKENHLYKATITFADGATTTITLPKAQSKGYTLSFNSTDPDSVRIRITGGSDSPLQKLKLVARACGKVYYAAENASTNKFFSAVIPKNKFPAGIIQFTLLSQTGEPLNERLVFIDNHKRIDLNLIPGKQIYTARQKVNMELNARTGDNKASTGSFSVAIINEDKVPTDTLNETTILTNLLLTADLKGTIENPGYYFSNQSEKTKVDLDNLLLTQGYRHFEWKKVLSDTTTTSSYEPEKALQISGTVKRNGKPVPGAQVKLFSKTGGLFMLDTLTNGNGKFAFSDLIFADSTKFVIQSRVKKGQDDVTLELDTIRLPQIALKKQNINARQLAGTDVADISAYVINQKQFYEEQQKYGINQHAVFLKEVKVEAKKESPIPHSANLNGAGNADQVLTAKDIERFICGKLSDCLQGVLLHISFVNGVPDKPLVLDGMFVDRDIFADLRPDDIEGIEVFRGPHYGAIYGSRAAGGLILVTTKRARKVNNYYRYAPGVITYMPKGFYKAREFYAPQYDNPHTNQKMADLRSTIYWNPNIITDKDGKASFSYFNADGKGTYRVVIEGIDADGNLGRQVLRYKVD